ncbi:methyl-accepting chemotaxis protein, partial [Pseudomonas syringae pv. japonica str. M301072]
TQTLAVTRRDELGVLQQGIQRMGSTLRELYLPGFESMVKNANVASIMCG